MCSIGIVVNGKAAASEPLREAVASLRGDGHAIHPRVTSEGGDAARLAAELAEAGVDLIVAAGGDGTLNEVVSGVVECGRRDVSIGVVPFGTANDFATSCGVPSNDPLAALQLAVQAEPVEIDVGCANDRYFINVASGGFGAEVTARTPRDLKAAVGGAAYTLVGFVSMTQLSPYKCRLTIGEENHAGEVVLVSVGNGRRAGGGFEVAPDAMLNDGMLDLLVVHDASVADLPQVVSEAQAPDRPENHFVNHRRVTGFTLHSEEPIQFNLDGEPVRHREFRFDVLPKHVRMCLPADLPMLSQ